MSAEPQLAVGDTVYIISGSLHGHYLGRPLKIERGTKTQWILSNGDKFHKEGGHRVGSKNDRYSTTLHHKDSAWVLRLLEAEVRVHVLGLARPKLEVMLESSRFGRTPSREDALAAVAALEDYIKTIDGQGYGS